MFFLKSRLAGVLATERVFSRVRDENKIVGGEVRCNERKGRKKGRRIGAGRYYKYITGVLFLYCIIGGHGARERVGKRRIA